jgi:predicted flap endonuclease-1-like 5' DNA nuclease
MNKRRWLSALGWSVPVLAALAVWVWWRSRKQRCVAPTPRRIELDLFAPDNEHIPSKAKGQVEDTVSLQEQEREPDDLTKIEGIGPKISAALRSSGVTAFADLAALQIDHLKQMLREAGIRIAYPETWPEQAGLAASGKWDELDALQGELVRGRRV